jgi:hypothetical protein
MPDDTWKPAELPAEMPDYDITIGPITSIFPTYIIEIPGMEYAEHPPVEIPPRVMRNFVLTPKEPDDA